MFCNFISLKHNFELSVVQSFVKMSFFKKNQVMTYKIPLLAYMAINIDFDDNKPHAFIKQRFINYAFMML